MSTTDKKIQLYFVPPDPITEKEIEIAKTNYVMINWCQQIFTETYLNRFAGDLYTRITGIKFSGPDILSRDYSNALCNKLKEIICRIDWMSLQTPCPNDTKDIDPKYHVHYRFNNQNQCDNIIKLVEKWNQDKKFELRFPPEERRRIRDLKETLTKTTNAFKSYNVDVSENCMAYSFLPLSCRSRTVLLEESQSKNISMCTYVVSSVFSDIFSLTSTYLQSRPPGQCVTNIDILKEVKKRCQDFNVEYLRILNMDVMIDVLSSMMDRVDFTQSFQRWLALEDFHKLIEWNRYKVSKKSKKELCDEITFLYTLSERYLSVDSSSNWTGRLAKKGLLFLQLISATYIHPSVIYKLLQYIVKTPSEEMVDTLTFVINFSLYLLRFWLSWKVFLLLYPDGRTFLEKILKDPVQLASFVISLFALGIPVDYLASFLVNVTEYVGINNFVLSLWPSANAQDILASITNTILEDLTRSINLTQLGITQQYQDKISENVSKYTAKGYLQRALKSLDEKLNNLSKDITVL